MVKPPPPVISFVGKSGSGKTTFLEKLIPELKKRGYRIGTVKHTHHDIEPDIPGKDSARHRAVGAEMVVLASPSRIQMVRETSGDRLADLLPFFQDMDLVITEGFKHEDQLKIEIHRRALGKTPLYSGDASYIALVTDAPIVLSIPVFDLADVRGVADFIVSRLFHWKPDCLPNGSVRMGVCGTGGTDRPVPAAVMKRG